MGLAQYHAKRDFSRTPEPRGRVGRSRREALRFVVQKHAASHLHYDLRLEMGGVLKSWAVPHEPGGDDGRKRLAVQTEDHPLEYADFEGDIPPGEYGGGHMDIWDSGTWIPDEPPLAAHRKGTLKFELCGGRLKGRWALVRLGGPEPRKRELWLLVKRSRAARKKAA